MPGKSPCAGKVTTNLLRKALLRNEQTGEVVRIRPGESYKFQNSAGGNWFSWVVKSKVKWDRNIKPE